MDSIPQKNENNLIKQNIDTIKLIKPFNILKAFFNKWLFKEEVK